MNFNPFHPSIHIASALAPGWAANGHQTSQNKNQLFKNNINHGQQANYGQPKSSSYVSSPSHGLIYSNNNNNYKYNRRPVPRGGSSYNQRFPSLAQVDQGSPRSPKYPATQTTGFNSYNPSRNTPRNPVRPSYQGPGTRGFRTTNYNPRNEPRRTNNREINNGNSYPRNKKRTPKNPTFYPENPTYTSRKKKKNKSNDPSSGNSYGGSFANNNGGWNPTTNSFGGPSTSYPNQDQDSEDRTKITTLYPQTPTPRPPNNFYTPKDIFTTKNFYSTTFPPKDTFTPTTPNYYPSTINDYRPKDAKLEAKIASIRAELESKERMLKEVQNEVDGFTAKSKNIVRALRNKRSYFYDTLMLKTIKYVNNYDRDIEKQLRLIEEIKRELDSKSLRAYPWKLSYIEKKIRKNNLIKDSDQLAIKTSAKISELNVIVDDMTRDQKLSIPKSSYAMDYNGRNYYDYNIKPCLHPHHGCLPHKEPHKDDKYDNNNYLASAAASKR